MLLVTGQQLEITNELLQTHDTAIIVGTLGTKHIDALVTSGKIDSTKVAGKWETFAIQRVARPFENIQEALVIFGSDRRGTAYGLLELSRMIGVSPWVWWADVTPEKKDVISLHINDTIYGPPSVKYRGIFLNDEDWGLQPWAANTFEPEVGDMGPKTYAKIFELLLRLRANTIWPAMHSSTKPFYSFEKNKVVADDYGIVIGTSHAEPMLCNINREWDHGTMGEYRYDTNKKTINQLFEKRVSEASLYENIYTTGMRGEHDSPMIVGEDDTAAQVKLLEEVIMNQRDILKEQTKKSPTKIPQAFVPYKEVLGYYKNGLRLPEDITLVWTDDNYGYIRQLSNPEEQKRSGGAGVYYHTSYWGRPHDYLWLNSTHPVLLWEEMSKAYQFGSKNLWILNNGDIKPHEYNTELFLDMGWDMNQFQSSTSVENHIFQWASREFGKQFSETITGFMLDYHHLAFMRRPEFMAWSQVEPVTKAGPTELTQFQYGDEVNRRIAAYQKLIDNVEELYPKIPEHQKDAFYQLVYYPIVAAANHNHKWLYAYKNRFVADQGRASADFYSKKSMEAHGRIQKETEYYNQEMQQGKWKGIMNSAPRNLPVFMKPTTSKLEVNRDDVGLGLAVEGYEMEVNGVVNNSYADVLPVFNRFTQNKHFVDVFLNGDGSVDWKAVPKADWIKLSVSRGKLDSNQPEKRIWVDIDWDKVPFGENRKEPPLGHDHQLIPPSYKVNSAIDFVSEDEKITVGVSVFNPNIEELKSFDGFIEDRGYVSINAASFARQNSGDKTNWEIIENFGYAGSTVTRLPLDGAPVSENDLIEKNAPYLEYDFYTFNFGEADVHVQVVPTHAVHDGRGVRCAVAIDDAKPVILDFQTIGRSEEWKQNVLKNACCEICTTDCRSCWETSFKTVDNRSWCNGRSNID